MENNEKRSRRHEEERSPGFARFIAEQSTYAAICRAHGGSPQALWSEIARHVTAAGGDVSSIPPAQRLTDWRRRGWASPMHFPVLLPLLPPGKTIMDLYADHRIAKSLGAAEVPE